MNWKSRIQKAIHVQLSHKFPPNSAIERVENYKAVKRTLDKCRLKYAGSDYRRLRLPNDINTIKKYTIGKNTYKVTTSIRTNKNGWVGKSARRIVDKMRVYGSWDTIPEEAIDRVDWRASGEDADSYVVWEFVSFSSSKGE